WKYPIRINAKGGLSYSKHEQDIEEAIWIILGTAKGERVMLPEFGCGIHNLTFAPINPTTIGKVKSYITEALTKWEPRIEVQEVRVEQDSEEHNKLLIRIDYKVLQTNSFANIVYPFFLTERGGK
ncbi:MAG: GPW/gp25 family protein, partial [candidate division WOR-3 bacterium]